MQLLRFQRTNDQATCQSILREADTHRRVGTRWGCVHTLQQGGGKTNRTATGIGPTNPRRQVQHRDSISRFDIGLRHPVLACRVADESLMHLVGLTAQRRDRLSGYVFVVNGQANRRVIDQHRLSKRCEDRVFNGFQRLGNERTIVDAATTDAEDLAVDRRPAC
ncbi:MAG: hypothetical protein R3C05_29980 [Pirellulaceae bacterium]